MARPIAISTSETWEFVLEDNREDPPEDQVKFKLKPLPLAVRQILLDGMVGASGDAMRVAHPGSRYFEACKHGLIGWENFLDHKGADVPFELKGGSIHPKTLARLSDQWIIEIGSELIHRSQVGAEELGK